MQRLLTWGLSRGMILPMTSLNLSRDDARLTARHLKGHRMDIASLTPRSAHKDTLDRLNRLVKLFEEYAGPEEPTDLAARVIDADGDIWARTGAGQEGDQWVCLTVRSVRIADTWDHLVGTFGPVVIQ